MSSERIARFGAGERLLGIVTEPAGGSVPGIATLHFNAGVVPRIGPRRISVKLARALAAQGHLSLRFDLSGHGDSAPAAEARDLRAQACVDLGAAMDYLERSYGIRRFALIGICSGAVNAYWTALTDPRVTAVLMFDGYWYRTLWTLPVRHWKRFRTVGLRGSLSALVRRVRGMLRGDVPATPDDPGDGLYNAYANPPRGEFAAAMRTLVERGVAVHVVYGGSFPECYSYTAQFAHAFAGESFVQRVRCTYRPDIDHTFLTLAAQRSMIVLVSEWLAGLPAVVPVA